MSREPLINGFLPNETPLKLLNTNDKSLNYLHEISSALPKLLLTNQIRLKVKNLNFDSLDIGELSQRELKCLNVQLSFLAHAYIWGDKTPSTKLPSPLSELWVKVSKNLGRPPVLSYASYCLDNWHKIDPNKAISLDNVAENKYIFLFDGIAAQASEQGSGSKGWQILTRSVVENFAAASMTMF